MLRLEWNGSVCADIMDADNWRVADGSCAPGIASEGVTVATRDGSVMNASPASTDEAKRCVGIVYADSQRECSCVARMGEGYSPLDQHGALFTI